VGVLPGFAAGNKISCGQTLAEIRSESEIPVSQNLRGPVWNLARIRDENVININQTTKR